MLSKYSNKPAAKQVSTCATPGAVFLRWIFLLGSVLPEDVKFTCIVQSWMRRVTLKFSQGYFPCLFTFVAALSFDSAIFGFLMLIC